MSPISISLTCDENVFQVEVRQPLGRVDNAAGRGGGEGVPRAAHHARVAGPGEHVAGAAVLVAVAG